MTDFIKYEMENTDCTLWLKVNEEKVTDAAITGIEPFEDIPYLSTEDVFVGCNPVGKTLNQIEDNFKYCQETIDIFPPISKKITEKEFNQAVQEEKHRINTENRIIAARKRIHENIKAGAETTQKREEARSEGVDKLADRAQFIKKHLSPSRNENETTELLDLHAKDLQGNDIPRFREKIITSDPEDPQIMIELNPEFIKAARQKNQSNKSIAAYKAYTLKMIKGKSDK